MELKNVVLITSWRYKKMHNPRLVLVQAVPRSGSHWLCNTIRGLWDQAGVLHRFMFIVRHSYNIDQVQRIILRTLNADSRIVLLSHFPTPEILDMVSLMNATIFGTRRDPRDCVASLLERWEFDFEHAFWGIITGCQIAMLMREDYNVDREFRYEDGYITNIETLYYLCEALNLDLDEKAIQRVFEDLRAEKVRTLIQSYEETGVFDHAKRPVDTYHPVTNWHPRHVGDGAIGKYTKFVTDEQVALINDETRDYRQTYGYE